MPASEDLATRLLGSPLDLSRGDVVERTGLSLRRLRRFWHALGFSAMESDDRRFAAADCQALVAMTELSQIGHLSESAALALTRGLASTSGKLAAWQIQLIAEEIAGLSEEPLHDPPGSSWPMPVASGLEDADPDRWVSDGHADPHATWLDTVLATNERFEQLLVYTWRRHLLDQLLSMSATDDPQLVLHPECVVGFADLVEFTSMVADLDELSTARLIERFEAVVTTVVVHEHGRVVKTVGDEVVFVCQHPEEAARIGLGIVRRVAMDEVIPEVRVALARGPVVGRHGDVFGRTVNLAARLRAVARPNTVVIDEAMAESLQDTAFDVRDIRRRRLRGIGYVTPYRLKAGPFG